MQVSVYPVLHGTDKQSDENQVGSGCRNLETENVRKRRTEYTQSGENHSQPPASQIGGWNGMDRRIDSVGKEHNDAEHAIIGAADKKHPEQLAPRAGSQQEALEKAKPRQNNVPHKNGQPSENE